MTEKKRTGIIFVAGQFVLIALVVVLPHGTSWTLPGWLSTLLVIVIVAGLALMVWGALALGSGLTAMPLPNERALLRTHGPFRIVRHPIYSGMLLAAVAWTVLSGSLLTVGACLLLIAWMTTKAHWEEARLREHFADYPAYQRSTGMLLPRLLPFRRVHH